MRSPALCILSLLPRRTVLRRGNRLQVTLAVRGRGGSPTLLLHVTECFDEGTAERIYITTEVTRVTVSASCIFPLQLVFKAFKMVRIHRRGIEFCVLSPCSLHSHYFSLAFSTLTIKLKTSNIFFVMQG